jgi:hypothetical protein
VFIPRDFDGDTYPDAECGGDDCADGSMYIHPGAVETCNGVDDNCSGAADDTPGVCPGCLVRWYGGHTYEFCSGVAHWATARDSCAARSGYYLCTVNDAGENDWLSATAWSVAHSGWWIGFNDTAVEGTWVWLVPPSSYLNWAPAEPNNEGGEDCALVDFYYPSTGWNDGDCYRSFPYVCEHD